MFFLKYGAMRKEPLMFPKKHQSQIIPAPLNRQEKMHLKMSSAEVVCCK